MEGHRADAFVLLDDNNDTVPEGVDAGKKRLQRATMGAFLHGKPASFDYELEAAYQTGSTALADDLERASIGAYLLSGSVGYTLNNAKKVRLGLLYTRLEFVVERGRFAVQGSTTSTASQNIHGLYGSFGIMEGHRADAFVLLDDNNDTVPEGVDAGKKRLQRATMGAFLHGKPASFDYELEAAYQTGSTALADDLERASIGAYLLSGSVGYTLNNAKKVRLGLLYTRPTTRARSRSISLPRSCRAAPRARPRKTSTASMARLG